MSFSIGNSASVDYQKSVSRQELMLSKESSSSEMPAATLSPSQFFLASTEHQNFISALLQTSVVFDDKQKLLYSVSETQLRAYFFVYVYFPDQFLQTPEKVKALVNSKVNLNLAYIAGNTLVHYAAHFEYLDSLQILLDGKANLNVRNSDGLTPLHSAVDGKAERAFKMLLTYRADWTLSDNEDRTVIHRAVFEGQGSADPSLFERKLC